MDLENIKRGLRAEIKKRENEQYLTFQCNVRQMCKDVLAKLEEQESEIAELKKELKINRDARKYWRNEYLIEYKEARHHKRKRCLAMAEWCKAKYDEEDARVNGHYSYWEYTSEKMKYWERWERRWLKLAERFKQNNSTAR